MTHRPYVFAAAVAVALAVVFVIAPPATEAGPGVCGDSVLDSGEQCDDGNTVDGDGCSSTCTHENCGDGTMDPLEECDDGNTVDGDGCSSVCVIEVTLCGNGVVEVGESCDDGNTVDGDGCSALCQLEVGCPLGWPAPPGATVDDLRHPSCFPSEWNISSPGGFWNLVSWAPVQATNVRPEEMIIGSGLHADAAWTLTTGDPRVVIAILDSGMRWNNTSIRKRIALNIGELPLPEGSSCASRPDPLDQADPAHRACWDINGDGFLNVEDWEADSRVSDMNATGFIDGEDMIWTFEDGVDDDGNGYIDDIAGWDAYENDNNPADDTNFGHGTGRAEEAAASGNDGGDIGVCPDCMLRMVRVGESFLCDSNDHADGVVFAVDSGASLIGEALGCYNNTTYTMDAFEYAYNSGVFVVASMADETARHHNFPSANNYAFPTHSIRYDDANGVFPNISTFMNFENCTNFGAQLLMSAPSTSCSSGATGMTAGLVGLVYSAALAADIPARDFWNTATDVAGTRRLSADEIKGIVTLNANDINIPEGLAVECDSDSDCNTAASERCLRIAGGNVCSAECAPGDTAGRCGDPDNFQCRSMTLEDTRHCYPDDDDPSGLTTCSFSEECSAGERCRLVGGAPSCVVACDDGDGSSCGAGTSCGRGEAAINQCFPKKFPSYPGWDAHFGYGRINAKNSVDALFATPPRIPPEVDIESPRWFSYLDPAVTPDLQITGRITYRSDLYSSYDYVVEWAPGVQPLDGDWMEITSDTGVTTDLVGADYFDKTLLATMDLTSVDAIQSVTGVAKDPEDFTVTIRIRVLADPIGGGTPVPGEMRKAFSVHTDSDLLPNFPLYIGPGGEASPRIVDLDGNGRDEIIHADGDGIVHAFTIADDGSIGELPGWPVTVSLLDSMNPAMPANHRGAAAFTGASSWFDPDSLFRSVTSVPAVANIDGSEDGSLEVIVATHEGGVHVFDIDGQLLPGFPVETDPDLAMPDTPDAEIHKSIALSSPAVADMDGDGDMEIVVGAFDGHVYMWHHDGSLASGFPVLLTDTSVTDCVMMVCTPANEVTQIVSSPAVGDLDGDGILDIVVGTNESYSGDTQGRVYAIHGDGNNHAGGPYHDGWPLTLTGGSVNVLPLVAKGVPQAPALGDFDGDGVLEIAIHTTASEANIFFADQSGRSPADPARVYAKMENFHFGPGASSVDRPSLGLINNPTVADFNQDGNLDVIIGSAGFNFALSFASGGVRINYDHQLSAWDISAGELENGVLVAPYFDAWPRLMEDFQFFMSPAVADLDDDGLPEVINGTGSYLLHAINYLGVEMPSWPKFTNGWIISSPAVGDIDGDGLREVIASTRDGYLFAWNVPGSNDGIVEWSSFHHDPAGTGNYETDLGFGGGEEPPPDEDGGCCNCRIGAERETDTSAAGGPLVLMALFGLWVVRRRGGRR